MELNYFHIPIQDHYPINHNCFNFPLHPPQRLFLQNFHLNILFFIIKNVFLLTIKLEIKNFLHY